MLTSGVAAGAGCQRTCSRWGRRRSPAHGALHVPEPGDDAGRSGRQPVRTQTTRRGTYSTGFAAIAPVADRRPISTSPAARSAGEPHRAQASPRDDRRVSRLFAVEVAGSRRRRPGASRPRARRPRTRRATATRTGSPPSSSRRSGPRRSGRPGPAATEASAPSVNLFDSRRSTPRLFMIARTTSISAPPIWNPTLPPSIRMPAGADQPVPVRHDTNPRPNLAPTTKAPFFRPGTIAMHSAFFSRSAGMDAVAHRRDFVEHRHAVLEPGHDLGLRLGTPNDAASTANPATSPASWSTCQPPHVRSQRSPLSGTSASRRRARLAACRAAPATPVRGWHAGAAVA